LPQLKRAVILILDGVGVGGGATPEADSLAHAVERSGGLDAPNLADMGLAHVSPIPGVEVPEQTFGAHGRCAKASPGAEHTSGHWEVLGHAVEHDFPVFEDGLPEDLLATCEHAADMEGFFGNRRAPGTEMIAEFGKQHCESGKPILYTSNDSVVQIAAHEGVLPTAHLYRICKAVREVLTGENGVARVIARPFFGDEGSYRRTEMRKDFTISPPSLLTDATSKAKMPVVALGPIAEHVADRGLAASAKMLNNDDGYAKLQKALSNEKLTSGLIVATFADFDRPWARSGDCDGYVRGLEAFDSALAQVLELLVEGDLVVVTADHGCDPTLIDSIPSPSHTHEDVPLFAYGPGFANGIDLGRRETLADIAATVAEGFGLPAPSSGTSFLSALAG
jgi:phosphopentomutase